MNLRIKYCFLINGMCNSPTEGSFKLNFLNIFGGGKKKSLHQAVFVFPEVFTNVLNSNP